MYMAYGKNQNFSKITLIIIIIQNLINRRYGQMKKNEKNTKRFSKIVKREAFLFLFRFFAASTFISISFRCLP